MKSTAHLRRRILSREGSVAVVGQGYVGLSLACAAAEAGFPVTGVDVDESRVADLREGALTVPGVSEMEFRSGLATGRITFTAESAGIEDSDVIVICVP